MHQPGSVTERPRRVTSAHLPRPDGARPAGHHPAIVPAHSAQMPEDHGRDDADGAITVDVAALPGGGQLRLLKWGGEFSIQLGSDELMGSEDHLSEQALATLTCDRLASRDGCVLIGGLGMGFTLGAALAAWSPAATIHVAELVPEVIAWAKGPLAAICGVHLADPRVVLDRVDVHDVIAGSPDRFDAIMLDVDNGPDGFIQPENDRLYCNWGLRSAYAALRPGGVLAIWSSYADTDFAARLEAAGFAVDEVRMPAFEGSTDKWHNIWFAAKPAAAPTRRS